MHHENLNEDMDKDLSILKSLRESGSVLERAAIPFKFSELMTFVTDHFEVIDL